MRALRGDAGGHRYGDEGHTAPPRGGRHLQRSRAREALWDRHSGSASQRARGVPTPRRSEGAQALPGAKRTMTNRQTWDPERYAKNARFVADLGAPVVELLAPRS